MADFVFTWRFNPQEPWREVYIYNSDLYCPLTRAANTIVGILDRVGLHPWNFLPDGSEDEIANLNYLAQFALLANLNRALRSGVEDLPPPAPGTPDR